MQEITLDYDIDFKTFKHSENYRRLEQYFITHAHAVRSISYRRSASGNTHVKIVYRKWINIDEYESFKIRSFLHDDIYRLVLDLKRRHQGLEFMRLWDFKSKGKRMVHAGKWCVLFEN